MSENAVLKALGEIAGIVDDLAARVRVIEARLVDLDRKHETVEAARRSWRIWGRAGADVILISDATETCQLPLAVARVIAAGKTLDAMVRDASGDHVELVRGSQVLARLPRAAMAALPRVLSQPDAAKLLGSVVSVSR